MFNSMRGTMTDENTFVPPSSLMNKVLNNPIKPSSKPYISGTSQTRACLADISNQMITKTSSTNTLFKNKPSNVSLAGPVNSLNNSKENIKPMISSKPHSFVPTCIPPNTQHSLITPSTISSITSNPVSNPLPVLNTTTPVHNMPISVHSPPPKKVSLINSPKIDEKDSVDPQYCAEYVKDIINHYRSIERKYLPDPNYMLRQTDLQPNMRAILIDWLIDVHCKFKLVPETLYLTINIVDRFLSDKVVSRQRLQLVGVTAMFVASKYEEILSPVVADFVKITKEAYTRDEVLRMERIMLQVLDFNLTVASSNVFLKRYVKCGRCTELQSYIATYLTELSLMDYAQLEFSPSTIACAAVYLSKHLTQDLEKWDLVLQHYTDKSEEDILPCARVMLRYLKKISSQRRDAHTKPLVAAVNKYKKEDHLSASRVCAKMADTVQI